MKKQFGLVGWRSSIGVLSWVCAEAFAPAARAQTGVALQPFAQQVRQAETTLAYLGQPLSQADQDAINMAIGNHDEAAVAELQKVLDPAHPER